jgi:hypothetical protein
MMPLFDLPLDIYPDVSLSALSASELQVLAVKAIKLERNWSKPGPTIKRFAPIIHSTNDMYVDAMTLLPGAKWLVTLQRGQTSSCISLWSLHDLNVVRNVATLHFQRGVSSYWTGMHQDDTVILTVSIVSHDQR